MEDYKKLKIKLAGLKVPNTPVKLKYFYDDEQDAAPELQTDQKKDIPPAHQLPMRGSSEKTSQQNPLFSGSEIVDTEPAAEIHAPIVQAIPEEGEMEKLPLLYASEEGNS